MGFDTFFGYLNQRHAHNYYPSFLFRDEARVPLRNVPEKEDEEGAGWARTRVEYSHDVIVDAALRWVDENRAKPFFLYLAVTLPHANNEAKAGTALISARVTGRASADTGARYTTYALPVLSAG